MRELDGCIDNPWRALQALTPARVALGRCGVSLPTEVHLAFQLAHAQARDAVHLALDVPALLRQCTSAGLAGTASALLLASAALGRQDYLQRPDLGRCLDGASRQLLQQHLAVAPRGYDLALVVGDGLSALAITRQAPVFLATLYPLLNAAGLTVAPLCVATQARVALGDEIAVLLGARMVLVLIGERPGLSVPDSMGLYLTWEPQIGIADARRNCISNVRDGGLAPAAAAQQLFRLLCRGRELGLTGIGLKDDASVTLESTTRPNFLLDSSAPKAGLIL